jgi:hypothetical protein
MGHETSLPLMAEHRLWVFEYKMLKKFLGHTGRSKQEIKGNFALSI